MDAISANAYTIRHVYNGNLGIYHNHIFNVSNCIGWPLCYVEVYKKWLTMSYCMLR